MALQLEIEIYTLGVDLSLHQGDHGYIWLSKYHIW
jgi:hypothetical protein